ncbi:MAG: gamma carbonic anhydrase family protein [Omnitrophica bacterium RIFCSPHIGHO2_02_FULL_63_14]|nr:MAG: gamma carbonic anhydrase family protein [Omnitrophica bacterium RIFCSPHIGHO2_02_FULL_63_14]
MIMPFKNKRPRIHPSVFIAPGAHVIGDVRLARGVSVWFGAVLRGDIHTIEVGEETNLQDNCVVHVDENRPCRIGRRVIVGHHATVHACTVGDRVLIGIGAKILSRANVGNDCLIGAGAVVLEGANIPPRSLVLGIPGKIVRSLDADEVAGHALWAKRYAALAKQYKDYLG